MPYKTDKLEEKEGRKVILDNEEISASDFKQRKISSSQWNDSMTKK